VHIHPHSTKDGHTHTVVPLQSIYCDQYNARTDSPDSSCSGEGKRVVNERGQDSVGACKLKIMAMRNKISQWLGGASGAGGSEPS